MTSAVASASSVIPASTPVAPVSSPGSNLGKDDFLKLMVAQMRNQDPMDPLKGQDLAAQMAQFSSLEQLVNIDQTLTGQSAQSQAIAAAVNASTATAALGRTITATGDQVAVTNGTPADVTFDVAGTGGAATLHVYDSNGAEVGTCSLGTVAGGKQTASLGTAANGLPSGVYTYSVEVKDASGAAVDVTPYIVGRADRIQYTPDGPVLGVGPLTVPFGTVVEIGATS